MGVGDEGRGMGRLLQDSSLYLLGNLAGRAVGFLAIPFYSRYLSPAQYGLIELVELSTQTIAIAFGLQAVGSALSRLFYDQATPEAGREVVSTSLIGTAALSLVMLVVVMVGAGPLSEAVFHTDAWAGLLRAAFVAMFFSNLIEVALVYERMLHHAGFVLQYSLWTLGATLGLNIVLIGVLGAGVWGFVISKLVVSAVSSVYFAGRMGRAVGWRWRGGYIRELVRFGAPLIVSSLSYFAVHFSDRFFLSAAVSVADLGRYALAYTFAMLISALLGDSFLKAWQVTLFRYVGEAGWQTRFAEVASYLTYVLFAAGVGITLFSPEVLRIMVPSDYLPLPFVLPVLIAAYVAREVGDFFRTLLLINKRTGLLGRVAFAIAGLNLVVNFLLIPRYGVYGAAAATLVTWVVSMVAWWAIADAEHGLPVRKLAFVRIGVLAGVVYAGAYASRVASIVVQIGLDGVWSLAFCAAAFWVFFNAAERRGAWAVVGMGMGWLRRASGARGLQ